MKSDPPKEWRDSNRDNWDKRVPIHLVAEEYDLTPLRQGRGRLFPIDEALLGEVAGKRILHLQCHFGRDTLVLAQNGASVTGVDFSDLAIKQARKISREIDLDARASFFACDLFDAPGVVPGEGAYDIVYTSWGTIGWLPDIEGWARVVAHFLKPDGRLVFADGHPAALVFDDEKPEADGRPGWFLPYFYDETFVDQDTLDYTGGNHVVQGKVFEWMHTISDVVGALLGAGLTIENLQEYDRIPWPMFSTLEKRKDGLFHWPREAWFPLSWSIIAKKRS